MSISALKVSKLGFMNRGLVWDLIKRDLKIRYQGSMIGRYWNVIHPLAMITIYTVVFSKVMEAKIGGRASTSSFGYTIYLCAGLIPWMAFSETVLRGTDAFIENAHLIKKIAFPSEILPLVIGGSCGITFVISFFIYLLLLIFSGYGIGSAIVFAPVAFIMLSIFALGLAMLLSVLNVFFRDTKQVVSIVFQVWFWLTPVIYLAENAPKLWKWIFLLNPAYYFIEIFHQILVEQQWPDLKFMAMAGVISVLTFILGASMISRFKSEIPDEI